MDQLGRQRHPTARKLSRGKLPSPPTEHRGRIWPLERHKSAAPRPLGAILDDMELMSEFISSAKSRALIAGAFSAAVFVCLAAAQTNTSTPDFSSGAVAWTVGPAYADFIAVPGST